MKKLLVLFMAGLLAFQVVACSTGGNTKNTESEGTESGDNTDVNNKSDPDTIKIGSVFDLSKVNKDKGVPSVKAIKLAVKLTNNGTVLGKKVEVVAEDDEDSAATATEKTTKLVEKDKVTAFVSGMLSKITLAAAVPAVDAGIPFMATTASNADITKLGTNMYRAIFIDPYQGKIMGNFAFNELACKNIAVLLNKSDNYSSGLAREFKNSFLKAGGKIDGVFEYSNTDVDFSSIAKIIAQSKSQAVFIPETSSEKIKLIIETINKYAKDNGVKIKYLGGDGWDGVVKVTSGMDLEGYYASGFSLEDTSKDAQDFIQNYKKEYGEAPNSYAAFAYDGTKMMLAAIEKAGSTDSKAILDALAQTDYTGVTGEIKYGADRDPNRSLTIIKINNDKESFFKKLDPEK